MKLTHQNDRTLPMLRRKLLSKLFFTITLLAALMHTSVSFADSISGTLTLIDGKFQLIETSTQKTFPIKPMTIEMQSILQKMSDGDFIAGTGSYINSDIVLDTIDFVGFKKLIGLWKSGQYSMSFTSFSNAQATLPYDIFHQDTLPLQYSISYGENDTWKIFLSSQSKVETATLEFKNSEITLKFYDRNNLDITTTLIFTKNATQAIQDNISK